MCFILVFERKLWNTTSYRHVVLFHFRCPLRVLKPPLWPERRRIFSKHVTVVVRNPTIDSDNGLREFELD